jgi:Zn-dependent protease
VLSFTEGDTMGGWWVEAAWNSSPTFLVSWVFWVIFSIVLHELGHGWAAIRCGDRTPIELGHMTWNPKVHMGPMSLIALALFGLAWGAMPVNPSRFRGHYDEFKVSGAGPAVNLSLALFTGVASGLWIALAGGHLFENIHADDHVYENVKIFLNWGCTLNVALALLNLLPIPPLDGSRMLADVSPGYRRLYHHENAMGFGMVAFLVVFFYGSQYLWLAGHGVNDALVNAVLRVLAPQAL